MATAQQSPVLQNDTPHDASPESVEGLVLEADYEEDRPNSLLAERQREFQKRLKEHYVDAEMPAA